MIIIFILTRGVKRLGVYKTAQRESILLFLGMHSDKDMSVHEISEGMKNESSDLNVPSESTIYRIMNRLTELGITTRKTDSSREYRYRLCSENPPRLIFKCKKCGRVHEIDEKVSSSIINELNENCPIGDNDEILLTGICDNCK
jgi:Fe2+ or Zn2+ uptake regulation protein